MVNGGSEGEPATLEHRDLQHARVDHGLVGVRVGHQLFDKIRSRVIEVADGVESGVRRGKNKGDALAVGAKELEAVVGAAAESGGERVVMDESGGEGCGDDVAGVGGGSG